MARWGGEPRERWGRLGFEGSLREIRSELGAYQRFYEGVAAAIQDRARMPVDPRDAVTVLELIEAAQRSANAGEPVLP